MIDTVKFSIKINSYSNMLGKIDEKRSKPLKKKNGSVVGHSVSGYFKKLYIRDEDIRKSLEVTLTTFRNLSISVSLPKLLLGHNLVILTPIQIRNALNKLNYILFKITGTQLYLASVSRVDAAINFKVNDAVPSYLKTLGEAIKYIRWSKFVRRGSLYYFPIARQGFRNIAKHKSKVIIFYDKLREMRYKAKRSKDKNEIEKVEKIIKECGFGNCNVLRFEVRIFNPTREFQISHVRKDPVRLKHRFFFLKREIIAPLSLIDFYSEKFYKDFLDKLLFEYKKIFKKPDLRLDIDTTG